jgi:hypothetical protein
MLATIPAENLQRLITECGVSPTKVAELVQELPPKDFANILVDWFFAKINSSRYPIHEGMFRGTSRAQSSVAVRKRNVADHDNCPVEQRRTSRCMQMDSRRTRPTSGRCRSSSSSWRP